MIPLDKRFELSSDDQNDWNDSVLDVEDHFKNLQDHVDKLAFLISEFFPEGTTEKDIVSMDNFFNTSDPIMNDEEIISGVLNEESLEA